MSEVPAHLSAPAAANGTWLSLAEAARRLNCSERHTRRRAAEAWLAASLARAVDGRWEISTAADPALSAVGTQDAALGTSLSPKLLQGAALRKSILERWHATRAAAVRLGLDARVATARLIEDLAGEGIDLSPRTLYNWEKALKDSGGKVDALVDGRSLKGDNAGQERHADPFLAYVRHLYEHENKRSVRWCHDHALLKARETGWPASSYIATKRYLQSLNPAEIILRREGPKAFNDKCIPNIERSYQEMRSNEMWVSDHHQFDVLVKVGERLDAATGEMRQVFGRPWITAWMDVRSRKLVSWTIRIASPSTDPIVETFGDACLEYGVPEAVYTDNGKDYDAAIFTGITKAQRRKLQAAQRGAAPGALFNESAESAESADTWRLRFSKLHVDHDMPRVGGIYAAFNIQHLHAWKEHGQSKVIERFFGTLCSRFSKEWETYTGRSPDEKPEGLADRLAAGKAPDFADFVARFATWVEAGYHARAHFGDGLDGQTPHQVYEACRATIRTADRRLVEILCTPREAGQGNKGLVVHANGITWKGLNYGRGQLANYFGRRVAIRLRKDLLSATAWSIDDKEFVGVIDCNDKVSAHASREVLREAIAEKKRDTKALKDSFLPRLRMHEDTSDRMRRLAAQPRGTGLPAGESAPPPSLKPVRSDLETQVEEVEKAEIFRKAVGDGVASGPPRGRFSYQRQAESADAPAASFRYSGGAEE